MTRFEKIVLEQTIRKGNMGVRKIDGPLSSRTAKYFTNPDDLVTSFYYVDKHGKGTKYTPLTSNELVQRWLPTLFELQKYNTKDYIIILDTDSQVTGNTESVWDVFVANRNSLSKILDTDIKKLGKVGFAPLISLSEFQKLKNQNKNTNLKPAVTVGDLEQELEKKKPAIEKTKETVQNVIKGTETIDPNNLGKGTDDADAFQELLYQVGVKLIPAYTTFKKFASYRTKGPDGGWDGDIGVATLNMLDKLSLKDKYKSGDIAGVIKDLRGSLLTTESTNYFKGTGMNIKLKDLLREQIIIKPDDEVTGGGTTNTTNTTNTKKKTSSTNSTTKTPPVGDVTGKDGKKLLGIDDLYTQSVTDMSAVLLQLVNYVNNHETFVGYRNTVDDDEANALIDLVKPWVRANIQPKVTNHYNKYIKPYMSQYNVSDAALTVEYDLEYVGTNNSVTNIPNDKFRKIFQNYLILKANSSNTALNHPTTSAAYYNYAGDKSSYTIPCMFYYNYERSVHYWSSAGGRAVFNVDTDF